MKITKEEQLRLTTPRRIIQQKPKVQTNKKVYKKDINKNWKKEW